MTKPNKALRKYFSDLGSKTSPRKRAAALENGRKGGRPSVLSMEQNARLKALKRINPAEAIRERQRMHRANRKKAVVEVTIGAYHDYIAMNSNEVVLNPTPADIARILRQSGIKIK